MNVHASILTSLQQRGLVAQTTGAEGVDKLLSTEGGIAFYIGFDPTGASLHVGHLVTLMTVRHLAAAGHRPIIIVGGGTAMVGDPSFKNEMRPMMDEATIAHNVQRIHSQIVRLVPGSEVTMVNNATWLGKLGYIEFLRDIGKHFSVNRMLSMDAYKTRFEKGLSFIEFNYQLLQAYDYLELHRRHKCMLQLGGDDQWGNILAGVDLCRRVVGTKVEGMTVPLLTTSSGAKMGKTAQGAVWLDEERLSANDYYQFWVNVSDADAARFLRIFTALPIHEVSDDVLGSAPINTLKSILAFECTALVHGMDAATGAHKAALGAFGSRAIDPEVVPSSAIPRQSQSDASAVPTLHFTSEEMALGINVVELLVKLGWCPSNNAARRLLAQNSVRLGETPITIDHPTLTAEDLASGPKLLRSGKKRVHRLAINDAT